MSRFQRFYSSFEDVFSGLFFFTGVSIIFCGVISRYVFKTPLFWVDEISTYILVWGCILGWSIAQRDGRHIRVSLLYDILSLKVQRYVSIFASISSIMFCLFLAYLGCLLEIKYMQTGQLSLNIQFPLWAVYFFVPIAALMLSVRYMEELHKLLKNGGRDWLEDRKAGGRSQHGSHSSL